MSTPLKWFKSSYSGSEGGACLEAAFAWRKSSYSGDEGGACVEVAACGCADTVHVRDSKVADGPVLALAPAAWAGLTRWVRS
ncbi:MULTISPECIES: DUF397 domain-containing protein [unclassified Streptomyces]|uniref:DUF397 domain-containing protein n=1 Tax=unclassified Streptomyces TaxID=2593676 RepID=UPI000448B333|nr:DUF397 domain-containing protein [Streptomyces sp. PCS3-D2]WKV72560.1 DUF397 domain-containing protein [Streptomyces sp. PCS3-D2]